MLHFNEHRNGNNPVVDRVTYLLPDRDATGAPPAADATTILPRADATAILRPGDLRLGGLRPGDLRPGDLPTSVLPAAGVTASDLPRAGLPRTRVPRAGRRLRLNRTRVAIAVAATVAIAGAGTAVYAAWSIRGTGHGTVSAANTLNLRTTELTVSTLYPGGTGDVRLTVANPNTFAVRISGISFGTPTGIRPDTCSAHDLALVGHPYPGPGVGLRAGGDWATGIGTIGVGPGGTQAGETIIPAGRTVTIVVTGAVSMGNRAATRCALARYTLPVSVTAVSDPGTGRQHDSKPDSGKTQG